MQRTPRPFGNSVTVSHLIHYYHRGFRHLLANQQRIERNQSKLDRILANQKTILAKLR